MRKVKGISYKVHPDFFNLYLEPQRRQFEIKFKQPIGQVKTTELILKEIRLSTNKQLKRRRL